MYRGLRHFARSITEQYPKRVEYNVSSNLSWGSHIDRITGTAHKTHGFVKRNIQTKMSGVREAVYNTLVRPQREYAAAIWDPHHKDKTSQIVKVQQRVARWTTCKFDRRASVSEMLESLGWRTIETHAFVFSIRLLTTWSQCPSLITSSQTLDHLDAAILGLFANCTRQRTTMSTSFSLWQSCSGIRFQYMLLARQSLTYSMRQLASCNIPSHGSQVKFVFILF